MNEYDCLFLISRVESSRVKTLGWFGVSNMAGFWLCVVNLEKEGQPELLFQNHPNEKSRSFLVVCLIWFVLCFFSFALPVLNFLSSLPKETSLKTSNT